MWLNGPRYSTLALRRHVEIDLFIYYGVETGTHFLNFNVRTLLDMYSNMWQGRFNRSKECQFLVDTIKKCDIQDLRGLDLSCSVPDWMPEVQEMGGPVGFEDILSEEDRRAVFQIIHFEDVEDWPMIYWHVEVTR